MRFPGMVRLPVLGTVIMVAALLAGVCGRGDSARPAAAEVDWCQEIQQEYDALNRGEIDLENYAGDMVFQTMPICQEIECVGKDAWRNYLRHYVDQNAHWGPVTRCDVSGNTVVTPFEFAYDATRAAGVERIIGGATYEIEGDKIVAVRSLPTDMTDPQTAQFVQYWLGRPKPTFEMGPGRDADQSPGMVEMHEYPTFLLVFVRIAPGLSGVSQPVNIHEGTCADLGPVTLALRNVDGGVSHTVLRGVSLADLQTGSSAIAVQKSEDEPDVYVACGDIPAAAPEAPPAEPAPVPVIAPVPAAAPATGSSGPLGEESGGLPTWWYGLAAGATLLVLGGLVGLRDSGNRR